MPKQKTKYPLDREKQSTSFLNGEVLFNVYTSNPKVTIEVLGSFDDTLISDLQNAVDEVLKHHNK